MRWFPNGFYAEVAAVYVVLLLATGLALTFLGARALVRYAKEADQRTNYTLAAGLVPRFRASHEAEAGLDLRRFEQEAQRVAEAHPRVGIYLLDDNGLTLAHFPPEPLQQSRVNIEPVRRFIDGATLPILGDDPHCATCAEPFSAAAFEAGGKPIILYIVLRSEQHGRWASAFASNTAQQALFGLAVILLMTIGLGLFLFALLGRRLRTVTEAVTAFEGGDLDRRVGRRYRGEIGRLAAAFDHMADTIASHVRELRHQAHLRRESTAALVHDLRTPLASLRGYLELMQSKSDALGPDEVRKYADVGARQVQVAGRLVAELFELSKLEVRAVEPEPERFPIAELVQDVAILFQPRAEAEGIRLEVEGLRRPLSVYADPVLVERVLSNLIGNALRHTPRGGRVSVSVAEEEGRVRVRVMDTGPGIPADEVPHVFERFYRGRATRRNGSQAGLGLVIAKRLAELQGGALEVERTSGEGTTFMLTVPAARS